MFCKCISAKSGYHRDDCPQFYPDGTARNHYVVEKEFNERLEKEVNDVVPFYFKLNAHSSFYRAHPYSRVNGESVEWENVHEYIKEKLEKICEEMFNQTGNQVTWN